MTKLTSLAFWSVQFSNFEYAAAKSLQSCPTLCDPIDGSPPGSPVPGILQARTLEWVAISFSNAWKWKVKMKLLSHVWPLATPWTAAYQAPLSMGFTRQEYWSGLPLPSPSIIIRVLLLVTSSWNTLISHFSSEDFCAYRYIVATRIFASSLSPSCFLYFPSFCSVFLYLHCQNI